MRRVLLITSVAAVFLSLSAFAWLRWQDQKIEDVPARKAKAPIPSPPAAAPRPTPSADAPEVAVSGTRNRETTATRVKLTDQRSVVRAESWDDLLNTFDSLARSELQEFNNRYHDVIAFGSQDELDWLASNGYPLPEEILEAAALSLEALRKIAERGDEKAEFLYFDRLNEELRHARERHVGTGLDPASVGESREYLEAFVAADRFRERIADNASPFTGHALARFYEEALQNPHAAIGALYLSGSRGDHVATEAAQRLIRTYGISNEVRDALASYALVLRDRDPGYYQAAPRPGQ